MSSQQETTSLSSVYLPTRLCSWIPLFNISPEHERESANTSTSTTAQKPRISRSTPNNSQPGSFSEDTETFFCNVASAGASRDSSWNSCNFQELQEFLARVRLQTDFNWFKIIWTDWNWFTKKKCGLFTKTWDLITKNGWLDRQNGWEMGWCTWIFQPNWMVEPTNRWIQTTEFKPPWRIGREATKSRDCWSFGWWSSWCRPLIWYRTWKVKRQDGDKPKKNR